MTDHSKNWQGANDSMTVAKIQAGLNDLLEKSLTVAHIKESLPALTATQNGATQPVAGTGSQTQSTNNK